jgi:hypothetical protein
MGRSASLQNGVAGRCVGGTVSRAVRDFSGLRHSRREQIVAWDRDAKRVLGMSDEERRQGHNQDYRGSSAWGKRGVAISLIRNLRATSYDGDLFEKSMAVLIPKSPQTLLAVKSFTRSRGFSEAVRRIDRLPEGISEIVGALPSARRFCAAA